MFLFLKMVLINISANWHNYSLNYVFLNFTLVSVGRALPKIADYWLFTTNPGGKCFVDYTVELDVILCIFMKTFIEVNSMFIRVPNQLLLFVLKIIRYV